MFLQLNEIALKTGLAIEPAIATEKEIKKALTIYYAMQSHWGDQLSA